MMPKNCFRLLVLSLVLVSFVDGQWTNRYPKIANMAHHVYLEGYNLPTVNAGPLDPAVSPDGKTIALAARGWLWLMDKETRAARRLTKTGALDSRPAFSPDGRQIVFVRDDTKDTSIVLVETQSGRERVLIDTPALDLDPVFSRDGRTVFYSSAESGDLDLWRVELGSGAKSRLTADRGQELNPQPLGNERLAFVAKAGAIDSVAVVNLTDNSKRRIYDADIASQMRIAASADGRRLAVSVPVADRWRLRLLDAEGGPAVELAPEADYALMPAWSADDADVYFAAPDPDERFRLYRVPAAGGALEDAAPLVWDWGEPTARVVVKTRQAGALAAARLTATDDKGHFVIPAAGPARFDGQHGNVFFYTPGAIELELPAGEIRLTATAGFGVAAQTVTRRLAAGKTETIEIELPAPLWEPSSEGWYSADLHSHLNYGGPFLLTPEDIVPDMRGERLDLATPQLANLHTRLIDYEWRHWRRSAPPMIAFAQEVRSHFLGHVGIIGADELFYPWFYGPGYPVYDALDLPNAAALQFARRRGGLNSYVHPVSTKTPFPENAPPNGLPLELVPDAVLGDVDTIEVACLWSDELGTSEAWYRLLNLGIPIAPSAGSDTMHNFYRTMAIGSARVYAKPENAMNLPNYLDAVRRGRSFVSNGPLVKFTAAGAGPGDAIGANAGQTIEWKLDAYSVSSVEKAEIIVNGRVVWTGEGLARPGRKTFTGKIDAPAGGWIAARVYGGGVPAPLADSYPFAHTAPIWFGRTGSFDVAAAKKSAADLLRWMDVAERRLEQGYAGAPADALKKRFADARRLLEERAR